MQVESERNPLAGGLARALTPEPCTIVIFGAGGDLSRRKLLPALYNLLLDGALPERFAVVGVARTERSDESFRALAREGVEKFSRRPVDEARWADFERALFYQSGSLTDVDSFETLRKRLEAVDADRGVPGNRIFYLSVSPSLFATAVQNLDDGGLVTPPGEAGPFTRVIVEKPIGHDLESALEVNTTLARVFHESQIFRIDHYLGKETVQNILVMRFGNAIWEPLWNQKYIDHVQITVAEEEGVGTRGSYYEEAGALRDMVQNHILQLLCLMAMEPPWSLEADVVRDHKLEVLQCLRPIAPADVEKNVVRAQYASGRIQGEEVPGYRQEDGVKRDSTTETYVALRAFIENWRWAGVPFFIRTGKRLPKRASEIAVQFKAVPHMLFNVDPNEPLESNVLALRIQPDEGLSLRISAKLPGPKIRIYPVKMDFGYGSTFGDQSPEAYERLLLDVMAGDATLFMRRDAVEAAWSWIQPILDAWEANPTRWLPEYESATWGLVGADRLIETCEARWRVL